MFLVLIVAKCNVNQGKEQLTEFEEKVLIVAKCNVNTRRRQKAHKR